MASVEGSATELSGIVRDVMAKDVVAVSPNDSAAEAAERLASSGVRHAIVIDAERRVLGVVSQRDIFAHFMDSLNDRPATESASPYAQWEIGSLIQKTPTTVSPDAPLSNAGLVLANYKIDCLPVVDANKRLIGSLTIAELLKHITGKLDSDPDEEFTFFVPEKQTRPNLPAFFRRANGALVIPISCLEDPATQPSFAVLGYEPSNGRIAVKFVEDKNHEGARKVQRDGDNLVLAAGDFVARFDIKLHISAFDVTRHRKLNCLVLTPKQQTPALTLPVAETKK
jgi:CBS domain-containing protein